MTQLDELIELENAAFEAGKALHGQTRPMDEAMLHTFEDASNKFSQALFAFYPTIKRMLKAAEELEKAVEKMSMFRSDMQPDEQRNEALKKYRSSKE